MNLILRGMTTGYRWRRTRLTGADGRPVEDDWCLELPNGDAVARTYRVRGGPRAARVIPAVLAAPRAASLPHLVLADLKISSKLRAGSRSRSFSSALSAWFAASRRAFTMASLCAGGGARGRLSEQLRRRRLDGLLHPRPGAQ